MKKILKEEALYLLETDQIEAMDYIDMIREIDSHTYNNLKEEFISTLEVELVNENITNEDFNAIMEELNEDENIDEVELLQGKEELDECNCKEYKIDNEDK